MPLPLKQCTQASVVVLQERENRGGKKRWTLCGDVNNQQFQSLWLVTPDRNLEEKEEESGL